MVHIRESPTPVALKDVATGQHVLCTDTSDGLRAPTMVAWCKVHNWVSEKGVNLARFLLFSHESTKIVGCFFKRSRSLVMRSCLPVPTTLPPG